MKLPEFFDCLDKHAASVPLEPLVKYMKQLEITRDDVADVVRFSDDRYQRNLLRLGDAYAALVLCWKSGQASPIHDHQGAACGVLVIQGELTETKYDRGPDGLLVQGPCGTLGAGSVCGSFDSDIHVISNTRPAGQDLITLHVYTPPMREFHLYEMGTTEVSTFVDESMPERFAARLSAP